MKINENMYNPNL